MKTEILIVGGGTGGVAAAMGLAWAASSSPKKPTGSVDNSRRRPCRRTKIPGSKRLGCTRRYRAFRDGVRQYYRDHFPLTDAARNNPHLNPGGGLSRGFASSRASDSRSSSRCWRSLLHREDLIILLNRKAVAAEVDRDRSALVTVQNLLNRRDRNDRRRLLPRRDRTRRFASAGECRICHRRRIAP